MILKCYTLQHDPEWTDLGELRTRWVSKTERLHVILLLSRGRAETEGQRSDVDECCRPTPVTTFHNFNPNRLINGWKEGGEKVF